MAEVHALTELILGGQKSGKSRRAEQRALHWMEAGGQAVLIATAEAGDAEMAERIRRHRAERVPGLRVVEAPLALPEAIARESRAGTLVLVDCLTLWLTHHLMPLHGPANRAPDSLPQALCAAISAAPGPVVLVGNEIGLGVIPLGRETREFVDALGRLNQSVAALCPRVTLMVAGLPLTIKGGPQ